MAELVEVLEIDLTDVQTEAEETGKTLRDLRNEVKELRSTLENTEIGTEEFGKTLTELTIKQQELTNVTKSGVAAQKGSYNDLVNQMALLKTEWRATADEAKRTALGEQIASINSQLKELDATVGNHQREVGNYKLALKNLKEELLTLEEGTEEYNQKLAQAAEIAQKMQDVNEFVAASAQDLGDHLSNVTGVAAGMVGMFQTVQASLNLIGVESESVGKMLVTMQNLMAITQGLTAIEGAIDKYKRLNNTIKGLTVVQNLFNTSKKASAVATATDTAASTADATAKGAQAAATTTATAAQWSLNAAMAANPLGAILIAITAVVTAIIGLTSWFSNLTDASEDMSKMNDTLKDSIDAVNKETNTQVRLMKAQGASTKEVLEYQKKRIEGNIKEAESNLALLKSQADKGWWDRINDEEREQINEATNILKGLRDDLEEINLQIQEDAIRTKREEEARLQELREEQTRNAVAAAQKRRERLLAVQKEYNKDVEDLAEEVFLAQLGDNERAKEEYKLENWYTEQLIKYRDHLKNKEISEAQHEQILGQLKDVYNIRLAGIDEKYRKEEEVKRKEAYDRELKDLDDHIKKIKTERDRALRAVVAGQDTTDQKYENDILSADDIGQKFDVQRTKLESLKKIYEDNIELIKALDERERERLRIAIESAEAQGQNADELKEKLASIGVEAINLEEKLRGVNRELDVLGNEEAKEKLTNIRDQFADLKNTFTELNEIGGAFNSEWSNVFDSVISGVDSVIGSLNVLGDKSASTKKKLGAIFDVAAAGFQMVSSVLGALAEEQDEASETGFERQKKFQIAQATMSMFAGILSAWASAMMLPPPMSWIMGGVMTAATATLGAIQIANIKKQKFDGVDGSSASATPTLSALQMMDTGVQATTSIEGASYESQVTDTKVYVVESDITKTQNDVKTAVSEATY